MIHSPSDLVIETPRLLLRPVIEDDAQATARLITPSVARNLLSWPFPMKCRDALDRIRRSSAALAAKQAVIFAILGRTDRRLMGWIGYYLTTEKGVMSLGFWLGEEFQDRGFMTEAGKASVACAGRILDASILEAGSFHDNGPALAVLGKMGLEPSGRGWRVSPMRSGRTTILKYRKALDAAG